MKNRILLILACCFFVACSDKKDAPDLPDNSADITIWTYLVANNNLDDYLLANIGAMYDGVAAVQEPATLLVYWDGKSTVGNQSTHALLKYETDGKGNINGVPALDDSYLLDDVLEIAEVVKEYPNQLSTDKSVMTQVLKDMAAHTKTQKVGLIAGSHASAWTNSIYANSRSFGQDGSGTDNTMLITDMADAIKAAGMVFEFLLFDACYMGTIEVCDAFKEVTCYQLVSPLEVPAYGFPYEYTMKDLYEGSVEGYTRVCKAYIDYYTALYLEDRNQGAWGTMALIDSKEITALTPLIKEQVSQHADQLADYSVDHLQEYGKQNGKYISFDMMHLVKDLNGGVLPESFQSQLDKTVIYKGCLEKAYPSYFNVDKSNYCGLGIFIPNVDTPKWNAYYQTTLWYTLLGWNQVTFNW